MLGTRPSWVVPAVLHECEGPEGLDAFKPVVIVIPHVKTRSGSWINEIGSAQFLSVFLVAVVVMEGSLIVNGVRLTGKKSALESLELIIVKPLDMLDDDADDDNRSLRETMPKIRQS